MSQRYRKFKRTWGTYYAYDNVTGNSVSLKTRVKAEADQKVNAMNETERQPGISLGLARVYLNATDPKLATRTWQEVMEHIVEKKTDETRRRWDVAIKDKNFDCIRNLKVAETRPEHFDRALADGKVSTNVYLRRIHNHALGMDWLLKPVIPAPPVAAPGVQTEAGDHPRRARRIIEAETAAARRNKGSRNSDQPITTSAATSTNCSGTPAQRRPTRPASRPRISTGTTAPSATREETEIARRQPQAGANPLQRGSRRDPEAPASDRPAVPLSPHRAPERPRYGVQATLRRPGDQGRDAPLLPLRVG